MIELLIGPYRSGKTGRLLKKLVKAKQEHPLDSCLILVPSHRYGRLVRQQLIELLNAETVEGKAPGMFGLQIATVYEACLNVAKQAGIAPKILPRELCVNAVSRAVSRLAERGELQQLETMARFPGAGAAIFRLIDEFERACLPPSQVVSTLESRAGEISRHLELAKVYREYWHVLDELRGTDQKRLVFSAREILARRSSPDINYRLLLVDGFDRISPLQAELMLGLSRCASDTYIAFDYLDPKDRTHSDSEDDEYAWKDSSYAELSKRFDVPPYTVPACLKNSDLEQEAFRTLDIWAESQEVVRRCKQALVLRKTPASEILVVARDVDRYAAPLAAAFESAGVPHFLDTSIEFSSLPLMKFLRQLFTLSLSEFKRRDVIDCLRSRYCNKSALHFTNAEVERLDKITLKAGVVGGRARWNKFLNTAAEDLAIKVDAFLTAVTPPPVATVSEYCKWMEELESKLHFRPHDFSAAQSMQAEELESLQGFRDALRKLILQEQLEGVEELAYAQFIHRFNSLIDDATIRRVPANEDCVYICSAEHAPNKRYSEVYVLGVIEGNFPKHSGESGLISSEERGRWASFGIELTNPREEQGFEKALFKSLVDRARQRVCFSHPELDMGGDEIVPSFYFVDGTISVKPLSIDAPSSSISRPVSSLDAIAGWLWKRPGVELPDDWHDREQIDSTWQTISLPLIGSFQRHELNNKTAYNGLLTDLTESAWIDVELPKRWSATSLGRYGECPFKFWVKDILGAEPREEPEFGLNSMVKGRLYHKALELFYRKASTMSAEERTENMNAMLAESLQSAVAEMETDPEFNPGPYWQNEQNDVLFRLKRFVRYDDERLAKDKTRWRPQLFEAQFGLNPETSKPPLVIETEHGPISISGSIDRVDFDMDAESGQPVVTVIDYKTGSTPIREDEARQGAKLQLPLYAMALQKSIMPGARVSGGNYLSINSAKSIGKIDFDKSNDLVDGTREFVIRSVSNIKSGDFGVRPYASRACKTCDHFSLCRITDLKRFSSEEDS